MLRPHPSVPVLFLSDLSPQALLLRQAPLAATSVRPLASPLRIGGLTLPNSVVLAPMAGVTDLPLREMSVRLGAGMAVAEMLTSDASLVDSRKSMQRRRHSTNEGIRSIQIVGSEPQQLAEAARRNVDEGADIIDINMGCTAKKVCRKAAGSALLADERQVGAILDAVVAAVNVPVTLKIRTGVSRDRRNGVAIANIAERAGIQMLAVHGRTRADRFLGAAEYDTIAAIVDAVGIPVLANGDITDVEKAHHVMQATGAAGVMIGRAAQGNPWLPGHIAQSRVGSEAIKPNLAERFALMRGHVAALHDFYGEFLGTRIARKHTGWFFDTLHREMPHTACPWKSRFNALGDHEAQQALLREAELKLLTLKTCDRSGGEAA